MPAGRGDVSGTGGQTAVVGPGDAGTGMLQGWIVIAIALAYIGLLFVVASYGDRARLLGREGRSRLLIYPLSLAIYCTSWTFFGSVGLASRTGYDFLAIYVGPVLMIALASPLLVRIVRLAKSQNITSIADFIAARYGKHQGVAALVALIAIVGTVPYIALQLKAVSSSLATMLGPLATGPGIIQPVFGDIALLFALLLLPRQFHVAVVENNNEDEIRRAAWLFPLYLVLINLFVVPIAIAGLLTFTPDKVDSDMYVLALPLVAGSDVLAIVAFVGGLSAGTAMVIVESAALAIMVSNDIVMPMVLRRGRLCSAWTCPRWCTACCGASRSTSSPIRDSRSRARRRRSSACRPIFSSRPISPRWRRASCCGARR